MVERNPLHLCLKSVWIDNSLRENHPRYDHICYKKERKKNEKNHKLILFH